MLTWWFKVGLVYTRKLPKASPVLGTGRKELEVKFSHMVMSFSTDLSHEPAAKLWT